MSKRYGVLLVAGGRTHQEMYAPAFAADPRCQLVGLVDEADVAPERRAWNAEYAASLGVPLLDDFGPALERSDVDIVVPCAEPERRAGVALAAAKAGKYLYMDKPLGSDLDQVRELHRVVTQNGLHSQMFSLVRADWSLAARAAVQAGALGELVAVHSDLLFAKGFPGTVVSNGPRQEKYPPTRFTFVDAKREVWTTAVYSLVFLCWLTGKRIIDVRAVTENYFFREHQLHDVEDFGVLLLRLEDGLVASVTAGRIGCTSHPGAGPMQALLVGTQGSQFVDAYRPRLEIWSDDAPWQPPRRVPEDPMCFWTSTSALAGLKPRRDWQTVPGAANVVTRDVTYFLDGLERGEPSDVPISLGTHATEALFAGYRSAAERRTIPVPGPPET